MVGGPRTRFEALAAHVVVSERDMPARTCTWEGKGLNVHSLRPAFQVPEVLTEQWVAVRHWPLSYSPGLQHHPRSEPVSAP